MKSLFEQNSGTYSKQRVYLLHTLILSTSVKININIFRQWHLRYLQEHRQLTYINLITGKNLNEYLTETDRI